MDFGFQKILIFQLLFAATAFANGTATATISAVNAGYSNTNVSPPNVYFPILARNTEAANPQCVDKVAYYNSQIALPMDPTVTTNYLIFDITPQQSLETMNGGVDPSADDTLVVKAEPEGSSTPFDLFPVDGSSMVTASSTEIQYGRTENKTVRVGLKLDNATTTDFCSQYSSVISSIANCQHAQTVAPSGFPIRIGVTQKGTFLNTNLNTNYAQVTIYPVNCPELNQTTTTEPISMTVTGTPLDGKVKLTNFTPTPTAVIGYQGLMLLASKYTSTQFPTVSSVASVLTKNYELSVKKDSPDAGQYEFDNLTNDVQYCFSVGYINYGGFISVQYPKNGSQNQICVTPSKIEGFLNRSTCFVATAAYGSEMDSHVELLRQFRNEVLLKNAVGVKFVEWYYSWSPKAADYIRERPLLRAAIRYALSPLILTAKVSLWLKKHF